jgi:circadian clock protein KaiB
MSENFVRWPRAPQKEIYKLRLYVTGVTPRSVTSILNIRAFCEKYLPGRHTLEIIDIYQQPELAREDQILAAPTLIKSYPLPLMRLIGDLSDLQRVMAGLNISQEAAPPGGG